MAASNGAGSPVGGREILRIPWSQPMGHLQGMAACNGAGPRAGGMVHLAQSVVAAQEPPAGDGGPQW